VIQPGTNAKPISQPTAKVVTERSGDGEAINVIYGLKLASHLPLHSAINYHQCAYAFCKS